MGAPRAILRHFAFAKRAPARSFIPVLPEQAPQSLRHMTLLVITARGPLRAVRFPPGN